ncbi:Fatty acid-binding protein [Mactra antiquata]
MDLVGTWKAENSASLAENMNLLGIPDTFQKLAGQIGLQLEISKEGDTFNVKQKAMITVFEYKFKPGEEFSTSTFLGKPIQGVVNVEGNTLVEKSKEGGVQSETIFKADGNTLTKTRNFSKATCTLSYKKI